MYEFTTFYREGLGYTTSLFTRASTPSPVSTACTSSVGIIMLMALDVHAAAKGKLVGDKAETVEMIGLYWHFVDIVWIIIFTLVYLIPA